MRPVASKLSELWQFIYTKATWNLNFTRFWNLEILLNFRDRSPKFCMWSLNLYLSNMSIATWGLSQLHHWFLRGGFRSPPPSDPQNLYPLRGRVKSNSVSLTEYTNISLVSYKSTFLSLSSKTFPSNTTSENTSSRKEGLVTNSCVSSSLFAIFSS